MRRRHERVAVLSGDVVSVVPSLGGDAVVRPSRTEDAGDFSFNREDPIPLPARRTGHRGVFGESDGSVASDGGRIGSHTCSAQVDLLQRRGVRQDNDRLVDRAQPDAALSVQIDQHVGHADLGITRYGDDPPPCSVRRQSEIPAPTGQCRRCRPRFDALNRQRERLSLNNHLRRQRRLFGLLHLGEGGLLAFLGLFV